MKAEDLDQKEIDSYRPNELRALLDGAADDLRPVLALGGLAGLRREEILWLDWADVWRVKGKIEISARIAKGPKRRLVDLGQAMVQRPASQDRQPHPTARRLVQGRSLSHNAG